MLEGFNLIYYRDVGRNYSGSYCANRNNEDYHGEVVTNYVLYFGGERVEECYLITNRFKKFSI